MGGIYYEADIMATSEGSGTDENQAVNDNVEFEGGQLDIWGLT